MRSTGGDLLSCAFLRVVVAGPRASRGSAAAHHTRALATSLRDAGHDVTLLTVLAAPPRPRVPTARWSRTRRRLRGADVVLLVHGGAPSLPRLLALTRGLRDADQRASGGSPAVVLVAGERLELPSAGLTRRLTEALVRRCDAALVHDEDGASAATALGASRVCVVPLPGVAGPVGPATAAAPSPSPVPVLLGRPGSASPPHEMGPASAPRDDDPDLDDGPALSADWARYVGAIETLAAPLAAQGPSALDPSDAGDPRGDAAGAQAGPPDHPRSGGSPLPRVTRAARTLGSAVLGRARLARAGRAAGRPLVALARLDLPEWVTPTDVLLDPLEADDARRLASTLGLPRVADASSAWAALGALAAVVRLVDDGRRSAVIVHETGHCAPEGRTGASEVASAGAVAAADPSSDSSPFGRWAVAAGFAPVALGLTDPDSSLADLDLDLGSLDALVRIHPHGCSADDVDEAVGQASWALRQGGILVVTVPVAPPGVAGALAPADLRGVVARAHDCGLTLVGDLDGDLTSRLSAAASAAADPGAARAAGATGIAGAPGAAYGLARLVLRRG